MLSLLLICKNEVTRRVFNILISVKMKLILYANQNIFGISTMS